MAQLFSYLDQFRTAEKIKAKHVPLKRSTQQLSALQSAQTPKALESGSSSASTIQCGREKRPGKSHHEVLPPSSNREEDNSKPLGMHISAIRVFLSEHPAVVTQSLTTSQTNRTVIKPETLGTSKPFIDKYSGQNDGNGVAMIGPATVFVSHAWKYSFANTVSDAMEQHAAKEPNAYFWFDLFTNDQNAISSRDFDWFSDTFKDSIRKIGKVLLILSPWDSPIPICRAWCLFEISTALSEEVVELLIYLPTKEAASMSLRVQHNGDCLIRALSNIAVEKAEATSEEDKNKIFSVISSSDGGFSSVNDHVKSNLREWYLDQLRKLASQAPNNHDLLTGAGEIFHAFGFYYEALEIQQQALSVRLDVLGEKDPHLANTYNDLAMLYRDRSEHDKALEYYQNTLSIVLSTHGEQHPDVSTCYINIGLVHNDKGENDKALEYYQKSLSIDLITLGENHSDVGFTYNNMGVLYSDIGDHDKALECLQKAVSIRLNSLGNQHPDVAISYNNMATAYRDKGDYETALEYHHKSLPIMISTLGEHHPDVAYLYKQLERTKNKVASLYD